MLIKHLWPNLKFIQVEAGRGVLNASLIPSPFPCHHLLVFHLNYTFPQLNIYNLVTLLFPSLPAHLNSPVPPQPLPAHTPPCLFVSTHLNFQGGRNQFFAPPLHNSTLTSVWVCVNENRGFGECAGEEDTSVEKVCEMTAIMVHLLWSTSVHQYRRFSFTPTFHIVFAVQRWLTHMFAWLRIPERV